MTSLSSATDAFLASRAADGDQIAFGILVRRHAPFLLAFATKLTGSRARSGRLWHRRRWTR